MSSYHGWTHAPKEQGGTDPIPVAADSYPYVFRKHTTGQTIGPGNVETIAWDDDDFSQAGGYFSAGDAISFDIHGPGVFDFLGAVTWASDFNSPAMLQVQCDAFGNFPTAHGRGGFYSDGGTLLDGSNATFIHFQARVSSGISATALIVGQGNAAGKDLLEAIFRVAFVKDWIPGSGAGAEADLVFL